MSPVGRFQILSLDGGGIKGLFTAAVLSAIEADLQVNIADHFDLIAGTSTGGIIALGLGMGLRAKQLVEFYVEQGPKIFRNSYWWRSARHWGGVKFSPRPLERALRDPAAFGENTFGASRKRLLIPAYNLSDDDVYLFRTPHADRFRRDWRVPAWKVAMATSAAPSYFPAFKGVDGIRLIDGGVWANNPAMAAVVEANTTLGVSLHNIRMLSIGCTRAVQRRSARLDRGGLLQWSRAAPGVLMSAQSVAIHKQVRNLLGSNNILRIDPVVPEGVFALDRPSTRELIAKAAHESRSEVTAFDQLFRGHIALPYVPLHTVPYGAS